MDMADRVDEKNVRMAVNSQSQFTTICNTATCTPVSKIAAGSQEEPAANSQLSSDELIVREDRLQDGESESKEVAAGQLIGSKLAVTVDVEVVGESEATESGEYADSRGKLAAGQEVSVANEDSSSTNDRLATVVPEAELAAAPAEGAVSATSVAERGSLEEGQQKTPPVTSMGTAPPIQSVTLAGSSPFLQPAASPMQSVTPSLEPVTVSMAQPVTSVQSVTSSAAQPKGLSWSERMTHAWQEDVMTVQPVPVTRLETSPAGQVGQTAAPVSPRTPTSRVSYGFAHGGQVAGGWDFSRSDLHPNELLLPYGRSSFSDHPPTVHPNNHGAFRPNDFASPVPPPASQICFPSPNAFRTPPNRNLWRGHPYPQRPDYGTPRGHWPRDRGGYRW